MFIGHVDAGLEKLIRRGLPLPETFGDVAFDAPTKDWAAQLTRITVNAYLYDVSRSSQPSRSPTRPEPIGDQQPTSFRRPQPMVQLTYLISAWAGGSRDEHQLLSDLVSLVAGHEALPPDLTDPQLSSTVQLALGDDRNVLREVWQAIGGSLRPAVQLRATVAADTFDWEALAPAVERVQGMAKRMAEPARG